MAVDARRVVKGPPSSDSAVMHASLSCFLMTCSHLSLVLPLHLFLQKPAEEVKQAWKVFQQLEARGQTALQRWRRQNSFGFALLRTWCFLALSCCPECSNHDGTKCADIHSLDPWSAADLVAVSRTLTS